MTKAFSHRESSRRWCEVKSFPFLLPSLVHLSSKTTEFEKVLIQKCLKLLFTCSPLIYEYQKRLFLNFCSLFAIPQKDRIAFNFDNSALDGDKMCKFNLPFKFNIKQWKNSTNEIVYVMQIDRTNTSPTHSRTPGGFVDQRLICFLINVLRFHFIASRPSRFIYGGLCELYYQSIFLINNFSCLHETPGNKSRT